MVFFLNWMHDHLTEKELQAAVDRRKKQEQEMEGPLEIVIDLADLGYGDNEDYADHVPDDGDDWEIEDPDDVEEESEFYEPLVDYEDEDSIALDMEEAIDDAIMFHGGNPFDWDTRSDFLDDPLGFGDDDFWRKSLWLAVFRNALRCFDGAGVLSFGQADFKRFQMGL